MISSSLRFLLLLAVFAGLAPFLPAQTDGTQPPGGDRPPEGDLPVQGQGEIQKMESLQGPENISFHVFTDPDPLPRGGKGTLYILFNVGKGRFLTRGPGETFVKPPAKAGPLSLGKVEWPPSSGNFRHPESGRTVPGWTGQVFVKIPVLVSPRAPLGPVSFKVDFQYRVLSPDPPIAGMVNVDPIQFQAKVGPPLPQVIFPEKPNSPSPSAGGRPARTKPGKKPESSQEIPLAQARGKGGPGRTLPGAREVSPPERGGTAGPEDSPLLPEGGGFLANAPLVFGAAGLLVLIALLLLFKGGKSR